MYTILNKKLLQEKWEQLFTILEMDLFPNTKAFTNSEQIPQRNNTSQLFGYKHLKRESNFTVKLWKALWSPKHVTIG